MRAAAGCLQPVRMAHGACGGSAAACTRPLAGVRLGVSRIGMRMVTTNAKNGSLGFGDAAGGGGGGDTKRARQKARRINVKRDQSPIPGQGTPGGATPAMLDVDKLGAGMQREEDDAEFAARLAAMKQRGRSRTGGGEGVAGGSSLAADPLSQPVFDQPADMYANPPKLTDTLMAKMNEGVSDPALRTAQIGPSQVGLAIGAVVLGLLFVVVSGEDFATSKRYKGVRPGVEPPDAIESGMLKARIGQLENALAANPLDLAALEEEAVSYAQLFEFDKAAKLLDKLTARQPDSAQAWRLLGETRLLMAQPGKAAAAYEKAVALDTSDLSILTGYADACIANNQQAKAADLIKRLKDDKPAFVTNAAAMRGTADEASSSAASGSSDREPVAPPPYDEATLDLLLAKVYSGWRGHDNDAFAVYDALIKREPTDFRGYLAKGLFLREQGRRADAERMFLQARYYAPESRQAFIKDLTSSGPVIDLPDNNS
eukprot:270047-Chlamydomonas_euryale.AAC.3